MNPEPSSQPTPAPEPTPHAAPAPVHHAKRGFPFHPLLLSLYLPLFLFAHNFSQVYLSELFLPLLLFLLTGVVVYGITKLVVGNWQKSAVLSSTILFFLLFYGFVVADENQALFASLLAWKWLVLSGIIVIAVLILISSKGRNGLHHVLKSIFQTRKIIVIAGFAVVLAILITILASQARIHEFHVLPVSLWLALGLVVCTLLSTLKNYETLNKALNIVTLLLVLFPLAQIGLAAASTDTQVITTGNTELSANVDTESLPDIYYIIPDEYAGRETLIQLFDFDNSEFLGFLEDKNFYVVNDSVTNYNKTHLSIPSSLNMNFIEDLIDADGEVVEKQVYQLNENNLVVKTLKENGYIYVHVGSRWSLTGENANADIAYSYEGLSHFNELLVESTLLRALNSPAVVFDFDTLKGIPALERGPKFVFAHMPVPHAPFFYDKDGNILPAEEWYNHDHYLGQLQYINKELQEIVTAIQKSTRPVVIIIQSDHGFRFCGRLNAPQVDCDTVNGFNNINAYYFSDGDYDDLYPTITPVNSFRIVFNKYLGSNYTLLEDKSDFTEIQLAGD